MLRAGLTPQQVDILVVNCSLFNPTPSLSAMIINHFRMRSDILSYNLAGMGCSAGVIAVGLADRILQVGACTSWQYRMQVHWAPLEQHDMLLNSCLLQK